MRTARGNITWLTIIPIDHLHHITAAIIVLAQARHNRVIERNCSPDISRTYFNDIPFIGANG